MAGDCLPRLREGQLRSAAGMPEAARKRALMEAHPVEMWGA